MSNKEKCKECGAVENIEDMEYDWAGSIVCKKHNCVK